MVALSEGGPQMVATMRTVSLYPRDRGTLPEGQRASVQGTESLCLREDHIWWSSMRTESLCPRDRELLSKGQRAGREPLSMKWSQMLSHLNAEHMRRMESSFEILTGLKVDVV